MPRLQSTAGCLLAWMACTRRLPAARPTVSDRRNLATSRQACSRCSVPVPCIIQRCPRVRRHLAETRKERDAAIGKLLESLRSQIKSKQAVVASAEEDAARCKAAAAKAASAAEKQGALVKEAATKIAAVEGEQWCRRRKHECAGSRPLYLPAQPALVFDAVHCHWRSGCSITGEGGGGRDGSRRSAS